MLRHIREHLEVLTDSKPLESPPHHDHRRITASGLRTVKIERTPDLHG